MKNLLLFLSVIAVLSACKKSNTKIRERLGNADSIAINYFKGDGTMDTVIAVKILRDKKVMKQLISLISASSAVANTKCGYDGSLHFFKENRVVQDIDFRMNDTECMYFTFKQEGKLNATILTPAAKQLLEAFRK